MAIFKGKLVQKSSNFGNPDIKKPPVVRLDFERRGGGLKRVGTDTDPLFKKKLHDLQKKTVDHWRLTKDTIFRAGPEYYACRENVGF